MVRVEFSDQAKRDLRDIGRFGTRVWGRAQAAAYITDLRTSIAHLGDHPELGAIWPDESAATRRLVHRKHSAFCQVSGETILIARVVSVRAALPDMPGTGEHPEGSSAIAGFLLIAA